MSINQTNLELFLLILFSPFQQVLHISKQIYIIYFKGNNHNSPYILSIDFYEIVPYTLKLDSSEFLCFINVNSFIKFVFQILQIKLLKLFYYILKYSRIIPTQTPLIRASIFLITSRNYEKVLTK